jgi:hypothetical protein
MLLGRWQEMKAIGQVQRAVGALLSDSADLLDPAGADRALSADLFTGLLAAPCAPAFLALARGVVLGPGRWACSAWVRAGLGRHGGVGAWSGPLRRSPLRGGPGRNASIVRGRALSRGQHPRGQHPRGQHPRGQHPRGQHPRGQHLRGQHPRGQHPRGHRGLRGHRRRVGAVRAAEALRQPSLSAVIRPV